MRDIFLFIFLITFLPSHLFSQISFDSNFDNGRVDSAYHGGDAYVLAPISNLHVRLSGVKDSLPVFKIYDIEGYRLRDYHRMVYRYEGDSLWRFFDMGSKVGSMNILGNTEV